MFHLTIETTDKNRIGDVSNAYNVALETTTINAFIESLQLNIGNSKVGRGANHIWIAEADTNTRIAIISNIGQ
jgi:hypothetical protein